MDRMGTILAYAAVAAVIAALAVFSFYLVLFLLPILLAVFLFAGGLNLISAFGDKRRGNRRKTPTKPTENIIDAEYEILDDKNRR